MSKKEIQQNFSLSASFGEYISRHPEILRSVPKNASIVLGDSSNRSLTEENRKIAEKSKGTFYQAVKQSNGWKVEKVRK